MDKVRLIYNPYSGENVILRELDRVVKMHQEKGYEVVPYRIQRDRSIDEALDDIEGYKYILVSGGDGTVDSVVNAMKRKNVDLPIGILPLGTANDFAKFLGIPNKVEDALERILKFNPKPIDLGKVNDKYFVNVASTGLLTDVSQKTDVNLKNTIGKLAYYLKGLEEIPNFRKLKVKITTDEMVYDDTMYLILVFNGQTAGNLRLATIAEVDDGYLDLIIIKAVQLYEILPLFIKILKGDHLDSKKVVYVKTKKIRIETDEEIVTDIDGEKGPDFPLDIECIKGGINVLGIE
ncbi:MAG: YegS/Rv2252/BmrU family lipid kinase [Clostridium sp.]|nr:YegS/Rv2252/BmrU family lipid kinase [Clostridium sp.]